MSGNSAVDSYRVVKWEGSAESGEPEYRILRKLRRNDNAQMSCGDCWQERGRRATWTTAGPPRTKYRSLQLMMARL